MRPGKVNYELEAHLVQRLIRVLTGIILVRIIRIELETLPHWKEATRIERGVAPLCILAFVEELRTRVRRGVIMANRELFLDLHPVAIAPRKLALDRKSVV